MLIAYQQATRLLVGDITFAKFNDFDIASYINTARGQVAGEGECVRVLATVPTVINQRSYAFTGISVTGSSGVQSVLAARMITGDGIMLVPREWEWFNTYYMPSTAGGSPTEWCQYAQGALGSFLLNPVPNAVVSLSVDTVCLPIALATDADAEAIPWPWTTAVPYYAAYMALLSSGDDNRATSMYALYEMFVRRARTQATSTVLPMQYEGSTGARLASAQVPVTPPTAARPAASAGGSA